MESSTVCAHAHSTATVHASMLKKMSAKMSCEPGRRSHYSGDLLWRIIWQREGLGLSLREILENLSVDVSTASRIIALFHSSGSVQKLSYPQNRRPTKKLTDPIEMFILHSLIKGTLSRCIAKNRTAAMFWTEIADHVHTQI